MIFSDAPLSLLHEGGPNPLASGDSSARFLPSWHCCYTQGFKLRFPLSVHWQKIFLSSVQKHASPLRVKTDHFNLCFYNGSPFAVCILSKRLKVTSAFVDGFGALDSVMSLVTFRAIIIFLQSPETVPATV